MLFFWRGSLNPNSRHLTDSGQETPLANLVSVSESVKKTPSQLGGPLRPEQKPVEVYVEFVHRDSEPHDVVCDLFCGSGTIAEAGLLTVRRVVAVDIDRDACRATAARAAAVARAVADGSATFRLRGPKADAAAQSTVPSEISTPASQRKVRFGPQRYVRISDRVFRVWANTRHQLSTKLEF